MKFDLFEWFTWTVTSGERWLFFTWEITFANTRTTKFNQSSTSGEANHISIFCTYLLLIVRRLSFFSRAMNRAGLNRTIVQTLVRAFPRYLRERKMQQRARNSITHRCEAPKHSRNKRRILCNRRVIAQLSAQVNKNRMLIRNGLREMERAEKIATNLSKLEFSSVVDTVGISG